MEKGDIIVYTTKKDFPKTRTAKYRAVVESIEEHHVDCGIDGRIHKSNILEVKGKSPSVV